MKFGTVVRLDNKISRIRQSKMAAAVILKNQKKNLNIFATDYDEIWHADASRPSPTHGPRAGQPSRSHRTHQQNMATSY